MIFSCILVCFAGFLPFFHVVKCHPTDGNVQSVTTWKKGKKPAKQIPSGIWK
jgi:hypothetical protein